MKKHTQNYQEWLAYQRQWSKTPRGRYHQHKGKANARDIPFLLTFEEWWDLWQASGKWDKRGTRRDQYVMARFGDRGAYERGNVRICPCGENTDEMRSALPLRTRRGREADLTANRDYKRQQRREKSYERPEMAAAMMGYRIVIRDGVRRRAYPGDVDYPA
jgi:hypothetical protein